ncbi:unnamed protein product [Acanthoscelides obtectus]|uniref:Uncharacterized protein n=1 Tax=Acanthoscelides obtectus TaxID=200917 RepID=A0A9P0KJN8_ACAOB|nr:unnamed protein product [Acanthoscelides obtectus]CAK1642580.1 hypothetical protein AOBTE_LOCUS13124 [Acanthoscelides obtectus]
MSEDDYVPSSPDSSDSDAPLIQYIRRSGVEEANKQTRSNEKHKTRKSIKGKTRFAKLERKSRRNFGIAYITESGKAKQARVCQPLLDCRMKCRERFTDADRQIIFNEYWGAGSHLKRVTYVTSMIKKLKTASAKEKKLTGNNKNRQYSLKYFLRMNGIENQICKVCFRKTFHYSRRDSNKKYLPPHYTLAMVYSQYLSEPDHVVISRTKFEEIFHKLNIGIKKPSKDTCGKCDCLRMKITLTSNVEEKLKYQHELDTHQKQADDYYKLKAEDKRLSKIDPTTKTVTFDLQQCLPTPKVSTGISFYLRQLWTFNLTVHDCDNDQAYCFMWHEAIAGRGANQVGSCIHQFLNSIPSDVEKITLYSDSCTGQNKNAHIVAMKRGSLAKLIPELQYKGLVPITAKKKDNLMKLLPYISDVFWDFYTNLPTNQADDIHPDMESSDEDE